MEFIKCPSCDLDAEIYDRYWIGQMGDRMEMIRIRCINQQHTYNMPRYWIEYDKDSSSTED